MEGIHPLMEGGGFNHVSGKYLFNWTFAAIHIVVFIIYNHT